MSSFARVEKHNVVGSGVVCIACALCASANVRLSLMYVCVADVYMCR